MPCGTPASPRLCRELSVADWRDWQKEGEKLFTIPKMLEEMEECYREIRKQMRSFKSNDLRILYVFFCITEHKFASEKRGMPKL